MLGVDEHELVGVNITTRIVGRRLEALGAVLAAFEPEGGWSVLGRTEPAVQTLVGAVPVGPADNQGDHGGHPGGPDHQLGGKDHDAHPLGMDVVSSGLLRVDSTRVRVLQTTGTLVRAVLATSPLML
jgi:hypothetical protein